MQKNLADMRQSLEEKAARRSRKRKSGRVNSMADLVDGQGRKGRTELDLIKRFNERVEKSDKCWIWTGTLNDKGYGILSVGDRNRAAHRISWIIHRSPIQDGLFVCHTCDNPKCVNPDHLFLGNAADNIRDCVSKNRHAFGVRAKSAKLDVDAVKFIKSLKGIGVFAKDVGAIFGVQDNCIYKIWNGTRWNNPSLGI